MRPQPALAVMSALIPHARSGALQKEGLEAPIISYLQIFSEIIASDEYQGWTVAGLERIKLNDWARSEKNKDQLGQLVNYSKIERFQSEQAALAHPLSSVPVLVQEKTKDYFNSLNSVYREDPSTQWVGYKYVFFPESVKIGDPSAVREAPLCFYLIKPMPVALDPRLLIHEIKSAEIQRRQAYFAEGHRLFNQMAFQRMQEFANLPLSESSLEELMPTLLAVVERDDLRAASVLIGSLERQGRYAEAQPYVEKVCRAVRHPATLHQLAKIYLEQNKLREAIACMEKVLELTDEDLPQSQIYLLKKMHYAAHFSLSQMYVDLQETEAAWDHLDRHLNLSQYGKVTHYDKHNHLECYLRKALMSTELGKEMDARHALKQLFFYQGKLLPLREYQEHYQSLSEDMLGALVFYQSKLTQLDLQKTGDLRKQAFFTLQMAQICHLMGNRPVARSYYLAVIAMNNVGVAEANYLMSFLSL